MKEILFRAKNKEKEWVYGYYTSCQRGSAILAPCKDNPDSDPMWAEILVSHEVDSNTVGEYIGMTDIHGQKIFTGDIVRCMYEGFERIYLVIFDESELDFKATNGKDNYGKNFRYLKSCEEVEIISNVVDNSGLVEKIMKCNF